MAHSRDPGHHSEGIEIAFGVTLGGISASANAGAHLEVTLRWNASGTPRDVPQARDASHAS